MDIPLVRPVMIHPGGTIAIVAPAGPVDQRDDFMKGVAAFERMGFRVRYSEAIFSSAGYLAGPDEMRVEELTRAFEDPDIHAIVSLRGGYGCARLIPLINPKRVRSHDKIFMGFSDLTTLHLYFRRRFGWVTFHGPMATSPALANISGEQEKHLIRLWTDPTYLPSFSFPELQTWNPGCAEGELIGGCLSLVVASIGTPYDFVPDGKILFIEDLGEPPYRIDRMIMQLKLAGKMNRVAGILLGQFKDCDPGTSGVTADETLKNLLSGLEVPLLANFPAGHGSDNWALPLGTRVRLDATNRKVDVLEHAVRAAIA